MQFLQNCQHNPSRHGKVNCLALNMASTKNVLPYRLTRDQLTATSMLVEAHFYYKYPICSFSSSLFNPGNNPKSPQIKKNTPKTKQTNNTTKKQRNTNNNNYS